MSKRLLKKKKFIWHEILKICGLYDNNLEHTNLIRLLIETFNKKTIVIVIIIGSKPLVGPKRSASTSPCPTKCFSMYCKSFCTSSFPRSFNLHGFYLTLGLYNVISGVTSKKKSWQLPPGPLIEGTHSKGKFILKKELSSAFW